MSCRNPRAHDVPQCDAAHRDVNVRNATGTNRARISCASRYGVCSRLDVAACRCDLRYPDVARESCVWPGRQRVKTACRSAHGTMSHRATLRIATLTSGTRPERTASESAATHDAPFVHGQMSYVAASAHYIQRTYALPRWLPPAIRKRKGPACAGPFVGEACRATHRSGLQNATSERHLGAEAGRAKLRVGVERARRARLPCDHETDVAADIPIEASGVDILSVSGDARGNHLRGLTALELIYVNFTRKRRSQFVLRPNGVGENGPGGARVIRAVSTSAAIASQKQSQNASR